MHPSVQARESSSTHGNLTIRSLSPTHALLYTHTHALALSQPAAYSYKHTLGFFVSATDNWHTNHWQQYKAPCVPQAGTHVAVLTSSSSVQHHSQAPHHRLRLLMPSSAGMNRHVEDSSTCRQSGCGLFPPFHRIVY